MQDLRETAICCLCRIRGEAFGDSAPQQVDEILSELSQLKSAREAAKIAAAGSLIGVVSTAAISWKYSRSPHGAALSVGAGAVFGWTFGQEVANHWLQFYRMDTMAAQIRDSYRATILAAATQQQCKVLDLAIAHDDKEELEKILDIALLLRALVIR